MGSQGSPDREVGPICVDLVLVPVCEVCVPLNALAVGSAEAARSAHLSVDPASETGAKVAVCRTGAAALGVNVIGPSLPASPLVATILSLCKTSFTSYLHFTTIWRRLRYRTTTGCASTSSNHISPLLSRIDQNGAGCMIGTTQVALEPRLIMYLCYSVVLIKTVQVASRNIAGCAESLSDHSPPLF